MLQSSSSEASGQSSTRSHRCLSPKFWTIIRALPESIVLDDYPCASWAHSFGRLSCIVLDDFPLKHALPGHIVLDDFIPQSVCASWAHSFGWFYPAKRALPGRIVLDDLIPQSVCATPMHTCFLPWECTAKKVRFTYSQKRNCARPHSPFLHSYICEIFIYSHDRSTYFVCSHRSWEYISQIYGLM